MMKRLRPVPAPPLMIRNISNVRVKLILVEHFDTIVPGVLQFQNVTNAVSNVTNSLGLTNNVTRAYVAEITPNDRPFATHQVSIAIAPFTFVNTDYPAVFKAPNERLRLTFEIGGERHQMYCPVPTAATETLVPTSSTTKPRFTGIYLTQFSHATLYETSALTSWMSKIPGHLPLGALSIPGTHNSPTCHVAPPSVRCQAVPPAEQLKNGVRFFDIRVQVPEPYDAKSDGLVLVHSAFPISLNGKRYFRDLYNECRRFLDTHPTETLIMSLKREGMGKGTDEQLSLILRDHYTSESDEWYTTPEIPSLDAVRGKIVLIRRFNLDHSRSQGFGIDASIWADNTPFSTWPNGEISVQDFYEINDTKSIELKIKYATTQLERSGSCAFLNTQGVSAQPLYINFLSGSSFFKIATWPERIAAQVNPGVVAYLCKDHMIDGTGKLKTGDWSTGIVVCDWVGLGGDWDLVRCIVGMNARLLMK